VAIALNLMQNAKPEDRTAVANKVIPDQPSWKIALEPFLALPPRPSTSITSPLAGVVHLVEYDLSDSFIERLRTTPRDTNGWSSAYRLLFYTTKVLSSVKVVELLNPQQREALFYYIPLTIQLVDDDISIDGSISITSSDSPEDREEFTDVIQLGRNLFTSWLRSDSILNYGEQISISKSFVRFWTEELSRVTDMSPESYRVGESFTKIMTVFESQTATRKADSFNSFAADIRTMNGIHAAASLAVWGQVILATPSGAKLCNQMIADATGSDPDSKPKEGM
jgi:E3 ubiquitin-protein ligase listerin